VRGKKDRHWKKDEGKTGTDRKDEKTRGQTLSGGRPRKNTWSRKTETD
jgi:hypothetical protein